MTTISASACSGIAIERSVEIISEASRKLPAELTDAHPDVAWKKIRDIGNILRHAYPDVEPEKIWEIATVHIRPLQAAVAAMIEAVERRKGSSNQAQCFSVIARLDLDMPGGDDERAVSSAWKRTAGICS